MFSKGHREKYKTIYMEFSVELFVGHYHFIEMCGGFKCIDHRVSFRGLEME